ncbi:MAG: NAD(+) diphosphatase [Desulfobacterales bacterium]|jgi:NAD+ diphosphatase
MFKPFFKLPATESDDSLWFVFHADKLLSKNEDHPNIIPSFQDLKAGHISPVRKQFLGTLDGRDCYTADLPDDRCTSDGFLLRGLRDYFGLLQEDLIWIAGRANQLVDWNRNHQYCGKCGQPNKDKSDERAKICPGCGAVNYPRLSPAIIVAVTKQDQILLANNKRFKTGYYSVLAGFVEPGENLEECVAREIREEVGITVKNIRYFGSQPWPFPNSLMVAFTAEYAAGEIDVDTSEIVDAGWFTGQTLPSIPPRITIARHLIDWFLENRRTSDEIKRI